MPVYKFTPWVTSLTGDHIGSTVPLSLDKNSVWNDPKWFDDKSRQEIRASLLNKACAKFPSLPKAVLKDMLEAAMLSDSQITREGTGLLPVGIVCIPCVYIPYNGKNYYFHEGTGLDAYSYFWGELDSIIETRRKELQDKEWEDACNKAFLRVEKNAYFLDAFEKCKPYCKDSKEFWRESCIFSYDPSTLDPDGLANAVLQGTAKLMTYDTTDDTDDDADNAIEQKAAAEKKSRVDKVAADAKKEADARAAAAAPQVQPLRFTAAAAGAVDRERLSAEHTPQKTAVKMKTA